MTILGQSGLIIIPPTGPIGPPGTTFPVGTTNNYHSLIPLASTGLVLSIPTNAPNNQFFIWSYFQAMNDSDPLSYSAGFLFGAFVTNSLSVLSSLGTTGQVFNGPNPSPSLLFLPTGLTIDIIANNIGAPSASDFQIQTFVMNVVSPNIP